MAGGSQIIINSDGIKIITPNKFEVKATEHLFLEGQAVEMNIRQFLEPFSHQVQLIDAEGQPLKENVPYYIFDTETQQEIYGYTDAQGLTQRIFNQNTSQLTVMIGKEAVDHLLEKGIQL